MAAHSSASQRFPIPWGLFVALGVYALGVWGYVAYTWWSSPEYRAAEENQAAWRVLGRDEGRHCSRRELEDAYRHLLRAAQAMPRLKVLHEDLEHLNWRFDERHWSVPVELRRAADAQGAEWARLEELDHASLIGQSLKEQGWDPESLEAGPGRAVAWSLVGVAVICLVWAYLKWTGRRVRGEQREGYLRQLEREASERGAQRRPPTR
jgi:hypothetical protein